MLSFELLRDCFGISMKYPELLTHALFSFIQFRGNKANARAFNVIQIIISLTNEINKDRTIICVWTFEFEYSKGFLQSIYYKSSRCSLFNARFHYFNVYNFLSLHFSFISRRRRFSFFIIRWRPKNIYNLIESGIWFPFSIHTFSHCH